MKFLFVLKLISLLTLISLDFYEFLRLTSLDRLVRNGVTHVVTSSNLIEDKYLERFRYMAINLPEDQRLQY